MYFELFFFLRRGNLQLIEVQLIMGRINAEQAINKTKKSVVKHEYARDHFAVIEKQHGKRAFSIFMSFQALPLAVLGTADNESTLLLIYI